MGTARSQDLSAVPTLEALRAHLAEHYKPFREIVDRTHQTFGHEWAEEANETLEALFPEPRALEMAVQGYVRFVVDLLRRQRDFEVTREYAGKDFADAAAEVYLNDEYMRSQYLPGLLLSHLLWPHHYRQLRFFDAAFVEPMRLAGAPRFVEVGVGTGLFSRRALQRVPSAFGVGIDISASSLAFTAAHMRAYGLADRYDLALSDVTEQPIEPSEWVVCVEVLEHLDDPPRLLDALRRALAPGGSAFITAALNAPNVDHIYLYRSPDEVLAQLEEAGFVLEQAFFAAAHKPTRPGLPVPVVAAFVVT